MRLLKLREAVSASTMVRRSRYVKRMQVALGIILEEIYDYGRFGYLFLFVFVSTFFFSFSFAASVKETVVFLFKRCLSSS